jgi:hypothetical protein
LTRRPPIVEIAKNGSEIDAQKTALKMMKKR